MRHAEHWPSCPRATVPHGNATLPDLEVDGLHRPPLIGGLEGMLNVGGDKVVGDTGDWYVARLKPRDSRSTPARVSFAGTEFELQEV
ncbi:MAG: hypothetical protein HOW73_50185 [Polyangiaceae bacterium]|nr:hypothetical protein [Polyangiaceae bacterium]